MNTSPPDSRPISLDELFAQIGRLTFINELLRADNQRLMEERDHAEKEASAREAVEQRLAETTRELKRAQDKLIELGNGGNL